MAPTIHCVRHAQGYHNLSVENHTMQDPLLTPFGEKQCATLRETFPHHDKISLLISSPLRRTIYTTFLAFPSALANGHCQSNIIALPEIQETSDFPCDVGSDLSRLRKEMRENEVPVDLGLVQEGWNVKTLDNKWSPSSEALAKRATEARTYIRDKVVQLQKDGEENPEIVVVTHGGFLHYFTEDWEDSRTYNAYQNNQIDALRWDVPGTGWSNAEYRSFTFAKLAPSNPRSSTSGVNHANIPLADDYENATLRETDESRNRRGKSEPQHGREKQAELFNAAVQDSGKHGDEVDEVEEEVEVEGEGDEEDEELAGLVRVLTKDSENSDKRGGEAPATDRRGESAVRERQGRRRRSSASVLAVAA